MGENRRAFHDGRNDIKPVVRCPGCGRLDVLGRTGRCSTCNRQANLRRAAEKRRHGRP